MGWRQKHHIDAMIWKTNLNNICMKFTSMEAVFIPLTLDLGHITLTKLKPREQLKLSKSEWLVVYSMVQKIKTCL